MEKAEVAVDTVALLIESNLVGYSPTTGQAARDGQVPPMAFVCIRTHFDEDSVTLFLLYSFFFSHDVAKQPEDNKNSPLCTKGYSHYVPKCLTKIPALIKDPTDYHSFHILRYVKVL